MITGSKKFNRDWMFYKKNRRKFTFCGVTIPLPQYNTEGAPAKECFNLFDSCGKTPQCSEPQLFMEVLRCKKSINLHIKMWADGYNDCLIGIQEYLDELIDPPSWVQKSLKNQRRP